MVYEIRPRKIFKYNNETIDTLPQHFVKTEQYVPNPCSAEEEYNSMQIKRKTILK